MVRKTCTKKLESEGKCSTVAALTGGSRILGDLGTLREAKLWQGHPKSLKIIALFSKLYSKNRTGPPGRLSLRDPPSFIFSGCVFCCYNFRCGFFARHCLNPCFFNFQEPRRRRRKFFGLNTSGPQRTAKSSLFWPPEASPSSLELPEHA